MLYQRFTNDRSGSRDGDGPRWRLLLCRLSLTLIVSLFLISSLGTTVVAAEPIEISDQQARESVQWLAATVMKYLPSTYQGDKGWGDTKRVWAGVRTRLDGFELKTHRRYRDLQHGRWIQYDIALPNASASEPPRTTVHRATRTDDGRWQIDVTTETPMQFTTRVQRWNLGLKLYSVTISGRMKVRLSLTSTIDFRVDYLEIPPVLVIDPVVEHAELELVDFEVERVSHIGGDAAEAWGDVVKKVIVERFIEQQNEKVAMKLNKAIDKHRGGLRFGWQNLLR